MVLTKTKVPITDNSMVDLFNYDMIAQRYKWTYDDISALPVSTKENILGIISGEMRARKIRKGK